MFEFGFIDVLLRLVADLALEVVLEREVGLSRLFRFACCLAVSGYFLLAFLPAFFLALLLCLANMKVAEWFDYICLQRGFLVWSGNCCAAKLSKKFVSLFVRLQLSLSEIDTIQVILHFSLLHSESIAVAVFFLDLPLLGDLPAVVDCLDDLKAVLHFHILLHHLAEEFVLHLPNHTPFRDRLKVLP